MKAFVPPAHTIIATEGSPSFGIYALRVTLLDFIPFHIFIVVWDCIYCIQEKRNNMIPNNILIVLR